MPARDLKGWRNEVALLLAEFGNVMTKAEGEEIMFRQIMSERDDWDGTMDGKRID